VAGAARRRCKRPSGAARARGARTSRRPWRAREPRGWRSVKTLAMIPSHESARKPDAICRSDQSRNIGGPFAISRSAVISGTNLQSFYHLLTVRMSQPTAVDGSAATAPRAPSERVQNGLGARKYAGAQTPAQAAEPSQPQFRMPLVRPSWKGISGLLLLDATTSSGWSCGAVPGVDSGLETPRFEALSAGGQMAPRH